MTVTTSGSGAGSAEIVPRAPRVVEGFPARRMRRLRRSDGLRRLTRETALDPADFIFPLFVNEVISEPVAISSMPGQYQWPVGAMARQAEELARWGLAPRCFSVCRSIRTSLAARRGITMALCSVRSGR